MGAHSNATSGAQRIAAFLLSLDESSAAAILEKLDPRIVTQVASAMSELDARFLDATEVDALYSELSRALHERTHVRSQNDAELGLRLERAIGSERAGTILRDIHARRRSARPFAALEDAPRRVVGAVLSAESTAVAALVLAHLEPRISAEILSMFDPERALTVVQRISKVASPSAEALAAVSEVLLERIAAESARPSPMDASERLKTIAQVLTLSEKSIERAVLDGLEEADKQMVGEIREFMFTWSDMAGIDKRGMQKILSSIETHTLAVALKGCTPEVEANVLGNLSARVRAMVAEERDLAGAMPLSDVLSARADILHSVRALMESGELKTARAGEEFVQ